MYCFSWLLPWIYTSSSSMDHRISSLLILASCMNACSSFGIYNRLPPSNRVHASVCILTAKCHKSFSNFLLIVDFFLSLLLLGFFKIDSDFVLSCSCYLCNNFHMNCLMYFILSCVLSCLVVIMTTILILLFFHRYSFSWNILSSKK
jgi:hypothetical protein